MNLYLGRDKSAILWREWLGLICAFLWFFGSMYSYYEPFFSGMGTELPFMLLLCAGLTGSAFLWEKYPSLFTKALPLITLAGAVCTGAIPFLPDFGAKALFLLSALFMTPLLCRRLYGVLRCARDANRSRFYISAVSVTIVLQMVWALLPLSFFIKFPVLSVFALLGLWHAEAGLPVHVALPLPKPALARTPAQLVRIAALFVLLVLLNAFNTILHTHVLTGSLDNSDLFSLAIWATVPFSFLFFAYLSDKNRERLGAFIGLIMVFIGCFAALTPSNSLFTAPLLLSGEFGGTITEFYFLTMPLLFFPFSKRPFFIAVSGLVIHTLLSSAVGWTQELWLPLELLSSELGRPLIIFGAVCSALLISLTFSVWRRQEDASLMGALLGLKKQTEDLSSPPAETAEAVSPQAENRDWMHDLDLLADEHRIATLLCDGLTRVEIAQQTGLSAQQVAALLRNIRLKLDAKPPVGQSAYVQAATHRYGLTAREAEVFGEMISGRSNTEISANLCIEVATVKTHVNKILKKTGMASRTELIAAAHKEGEPALPLG